MKKFGNKQDIWQIVIPLIIVSLILQGDLMAGKAVNLTVEKSDHKIIKGKLLYVDVRERSLVLNVANIGIKIYMHDIDTIRIAKQKSPVRIFGKEFLVSVALGASLGYITGEDRESRGIGMIVFSSFFGLVGLVGGFFSAVSASKETCTEIRVKGKSPKEMKKILETLKKKAQMR